jgi:glycosyltransferase involved in cell wall biosynthesis
MRLPFEGFLAAAAVRNFPLLISIWGNDFTLFADRSRRLSELADAALQRADGLHCDCRRDIEAAFARGFSQSKPRRILPGSGGIQTDVYFKVQPDPALLRKFDIPEGMPLVLNPRGFRAYIRNDTFFRAIPLVLKEFPQAFFVATGMSGNPVAERWIRHTHVRNSIRLLPFLSREQLANLFAASQISVSPSSHDGTPNTLLEAMACGCFPIAGDVSSVREWIEDGKNGLICDETDAHSLADCVIRVLRDHNLRAEAARMNRDLVHARADYNTSMSDAEKLYQEVVSAQPADIGQNQLSIQKPL